MTSVGDEPAVTETRAKRARPMLSGPLPDGWLYKESLTLLAEDGRANVIASSESLPPDEDVQTYADRQGELLKDFKGYNVRSVEPTPAAFGRSTGLIRVFDWMPEDGQAVTQIQMYYVENGRGFTATATANAEDFGNLQVILSDIIGGLSIEDPSGGETQLPPLVGAKIGNETGQAGITST